MQSYSRQGTNQAPLSPSRDDSTDKPKLNFQFLPVPVAALLDPRLSEGDKLIIGRIIFAANGNQGDCILSNKTIATDVGMSESNVERRLPHIEKCGYIRRRIQKNGIRSGITVIWTKILAEATPPQSGHKREV